MVISDGNLYIGDFDEGKRHGVGKYIETNGNKYAGWSSLSFISP